MKVITLATLHLATEQEVFDQVAAHLLAQGKKSESGRDCLYRGPNGLKCAAGCLISDDEYKPEMDGSWYGGTSWGELVDVGIVPDLHVQLISELQDCHDSLAPSLWEAHLKYLAYDYGLVYNKYLCQQNKQGEQNAN